MATTFYLRDAASDLGGAGQKLLSPTRGAASVGKVTATVASGTNIQVTDTSGGQALTWFTDPLDAVTIAGTITVNVRGLESAAAANAGGGVLIEQTNGAGVVGLTILADSTVPAVITEFSSVADSAKVGTYTPTSTALSAGDRIKVTLKVRNVGTMGGSQTVTNSIDGSTAAAVGDTFVTFTETVVVTTGGSIAPDGISVPVALGSPGLSDSALAVAPDGISVPVALGTPALADGSMTVAPDGVSVPVALGSPDLTWSATIAPDGIAVPVVLGDPTVGASSVAPDGISVPVLLGDPALSWSATVSPDGITVPVALGSPALTWSATVTPDGISVPVSLGAPSLTVPGGIITRPNTGTIVRPTTGVITRPFTGTVVRP